MSASFLATTVPLCKVKIRLFFNSLKARMSGKKAALAVVGVLAVIFSVAVAVSDLVRFMDATGPQISLAEWIVGLIAFYAIFVVFVADLLSGHTINAGQMSSDFDYLSTLPISPASLLCVKIFERFASDYIGALILLTGFIATTCRNGVNAYGIVVSLLLFTQISLLIGTIINLIMLIMRRHLPLTSINNFFSFFGYIVGFVIFIPYVFVDHMPAEAVQLLITYLNRFQDSVFVVLQPMRWLGRILTETGPVIELWQFNGLWLITMLLCVLPLYRALNSGALSIKKTRTGRNKARQSSRFSGLEQKDYLLMKSDYNIRINALFMPVTLIIVNIFFVGHVFKFNTLNSLLNMIFAGIIYFCLFGPTNAIGSEGRTISLLESLPLHPQEILKHKFVFWFKTAAQIFLPLTIVIGWYLNFDVMSIIRVALLATVFTAACVWVTLQLSAIFPVFDSKMLQQSSSLSAKAAALAVMLLLVQVKEATLLNLYALLIFVSITVLLNMKARALMFYRLETSQHINKQQKWLNFMLLAFAFLGGQTLINQIFRAVIPGENTGLWSWVLPALAILPVLMLTAFFKKPWSGQTSLPDSPAKSLSATAITATAYGILSTCGTWLYISYNPELKEFLTSELAYYVRLFDGLALSYSASALFVSAVPICFAALFAVLAAEHAQSDAKTGHHCRFFVTLAILLALSPSHVIIPAFVTTAFTALYCRHFTSAAGAALIAAMSTALPLIALFR
ncbi:MAG: hypothetical protein ACD_39C01371G0002 [uncultured bacterium]|nr:MAG: hypothetical protein ACD_39C01371G0002 [uncultured bacterium]